MSFELWDLSINFIIGFSILQIASSCVIAMTFIFEISLLTPTFRLRHSFSEGAKGESVELFYE
jgi:hypothetical protein